MSATLEIISNFSIEVQGLTHSGKQGTSTDAATEPFEVTVGGQIHKVVGSLATATVVTVYDDDSDVPADWDYAYFWADQDCYIQIIGSGSNAIFKVEAKVPFWIPGFDTVLAAADTTIITGGTEPTLTDIDSIVVGNYSGNTMNYVFAVID
jgi:hypothetical protein